MSGRALLISRITKRLGAIAISTLVGVLIAGVGLELWLRLTWS